VVLLPGEPLADLRRYSAVQRVAQVLLKGLLMLLTRGIPGLCPSICTEW